jgi:hypothetical protein
VHSRRVSILVLLTIVAMVVSAISPASVMADDFTPPPPDDSVEITPEPVDSSDDTNSEGISDGVDVIITDEQGQSVSLSSSEGVNALLNGQPVWCPDGIAPDAGGDGCTASFGSVSDLLASVGDTEQDGAIYIQTEVAEVIVVSDMPLAICLWLNLRLPCCRLRTSPGWEPL